MSSLRDLIQKSRDQLWTVQTEAVGLIGLDGYVDRIQSVVKSRDGHTRHFYHDLKDFSRKVHRASGESAQLELHTHETKLGGNAPIMANALAAMGWRPTCLGSLGYPSVHKVFASMKDQCTLLSVSEPARTNALEFADGKLILSELSVFENLTWEAVLAQVDEHSLDQTLANVRFIALVGWANLPHATGIWKGILERVKDTGNKPDVFFDIADPSKRSAEDIREVLDLMGSLSGEMPVTLGLNSNEANLLYERLAGPGENVPLRDKCRTLYQALNVDRLVIHPVDRCILISREGDLEWQGRLIAHPKISTGGGDNFNAGLMLGILNNFEPSVCMILAMATSGSYVSSGHSPTLQELDDYLGQWLTECW